MFFKCSSEDECKKLFRKLAKLIHPDKGGSHELMILLDEAYNNRIKKINSSKTEDKTYSSEKKENNKIYAGDKRLEILGEMWDICEKNPEYITHFFLSVTAFLDQNSYMTHKQYEGLLKMLNTWKIWETLKKEKKGEE